MVLPLPAPRLLLAVLALLGGCATPVAPSGGPADTTPPALVSSVPAAGAVRVSGREVRLTFDKRLDPAGAARAVRVVPEATDPETGLVVLPLVRVAGRELVIDLPELRDSTTVVLTVGTELTDARRVALGAPITLAFSTGDRIDRAQIAGVVRRPETGAGAAGVAVWAYALADTLARPDPRVAAPSYRTVTASDGAFVLDFLRPGPYAVAAVDDRNRSGRADPGERAAAAPRPVLRAVEPDSAARAPLAEPFWLALADTTAPEARTARALSASRFAVRFSEPVRLLPGRAAGAWSLETDAGPVPATGYTLPGAPADVFVLAERAVAGVGARVRLALPGVVADSAGNAAAPFALDVAPSAAADTVSVRAVAFLPARADSVLAVAPRERVGVQISTPGAVRLVARTPAGDVPLAAEADGVRVTADLPPEIVGRFSLRAEVGGRARERRMERLGPAALGSLSGSVPGAAGRAVVVEIVPAGGPPLSARVDAQGRFVADGLRPGAVRVRLFEDLDGDGRWSPGRLAPYAAPEPLRLLSEPVTVRARWETEIEPERLDLFGVLPGQPAASQPLPLAP